jgi:two-component system cell cycle response regulator
MNTDLNENFEQLAVELGSQDLKEILEVASQITAQLDIESIVKNVVMSLYARFQPRTMTFLLANDLEENVFTLYHYQGMKKKSLKMGFPTIHALIAFLSHHEYNQLSFQYARENFPEPALLAELEKLQPDIIIPLRTDKGVTGLILLPRLKTDYSLLDIQYITQLVRFAAIALENANLYWLATIDRMTRLYSHHFLEKALDDEIKRAQRYKSVFSLMMLDIDHFKEFNDTYGHLQGDIIIKEIARILKNSVRNIDLSARYGGEEFAVILPEVSARGAQSVAERVRKKIESHPFPGDPDILHVTISIGVAEFSSRSVRSPSQIIAQADQALFQSKESGRNRVTVFRH